MPKTQVPAPESLLEAPIRETVFAVLDTETTGCGPRWGHRICEVGVVRWRNGRRVGTYQTLVNPKRSISPGAAMVHGITDEMVEDAPTFREIADDLSAAIDGAVLVAHNAPFDLGFLAVQFQGLRLPLPVEAAIDTLRLARRHYRFPSNALQSLALSLEVRRGTAHRALGDAITTARVFQRFLKDFGDRAQTVGDLFGLQGGPVEPPGEEVLVLPPALEEALRNRKPVEMRYVTAGGLDAVRVVEPLEVFATKRQVYFRAFCHLRQEERTFRLDRIRAIQSTQNSFTLGPFPVSRYAEARTT